MHRRPTTTTTTTQNLVLPDGGTTTTNTTVDNAASSDHQYHHHHPGTVVRTTGLPVRRKRKKKAFSMHYNGSWHRDDTLRIMAGIICVLVALILVGFVIILRLLQSNNSNNSNDIAATGGGGGGGTIDIPPRNMAKLGDKSRHYQKLRKSYDEDHSWDTQRSLQLAHDLRMQGNLYTPIQNGVYDIYHCPDEPPEQYPVEWNTLDILNHWNPHDYSNPPKELYQGLCVFDYRKDYTKAMNYRDQELPFVMRHDPYVAATVERWNTPGYLEQLLGDTKYRAEYSHNNHFMYHTGAGNHGKKGKKAKRPQQENKKPPPTENIHMTYQDWLEHANVTDNTMVGPDHPHWYFRLIGCGFMKGTPAGKGQCDPDSEYLFDELSFFQPKPDLYMVQPQEQKGIHCRFGMEGVIAENHFDASRNAIVVLGGERRYILSNPNQCSNLALLPRGHPSARHSAINWADPDLEEYPQFQHATSNEVVLQAGDALYLPTHWFHYIVSLTLNFQCNTRSGVDDRYHEPIQECGF